MNLEDVILRGTRAAQPDADTVAQGTLYFVTDEDVTERSTGVIWESYSGTGSAATNDLDYLTHSDESVALPNSRRLLAGTNVTFDDSVPNERTINTTDTDTGITELTGEVTAGPGSGSQAATIANDAVTYGKIQNISAEKKVLGRKTVGAGDVEEITVSDILDFITGAAHGDIIYRDAAGWTRLAAGDAGKFLKTQGAGANPIWDTAGGGSGITELTGDVTAGPGSGSQAATIPNDTVEYAQMQNVSNTSRILGRKTAGAGDIEECTIDEILDFIGATTHGGILFKDATGWGRLQPSDSGKFLRTNGNDADPTWEYPVSGTGFFNVRRALTAEEIVSAATSPVLLVAAQGGDKIIVPLAAQFEYEVTDAYTNGVNGGLVYEGNTTTLLSTNFTISANSVTERYAVSMGVNSGTLFVYTTFDPRNKALMFKTSADLTGEGAITAVLNVLYLVITTT